MLPMRSTVGCAKLTIRHKPYICPRCHRSGLASSSAKHFTISSPDRRPNGPLETSTLDRTPYDSFLFAAPSSSPPSSKSFIRDHLRAWSVQNQKVKKDHAEDNFASGARLTVLPNSLFIEESPTLQDDVDWDDASTFDAHRTTDTDDGVSAPHARHGLEIGDLIYLNRVYINIRPQFAIYLGTRFAQEQFFLADGRWLVTTLSPFTSPIISRFAPKEEVDLILRHLPKKRLEYQDRHLGIATLHSFADHVPHVDAAPLLGRIVDFSDDVDSFRRDNVALLDGIYDILAHEDNYISPSFAHIVEKLLGRPSTQVSSAESMSIFLAMSRDVTRINFHKVPQSKEMSTLITPKALHRKFEKVVDWARDYQDAAARAALGINVTADLEKNPLSSFIDKARRLILKSRKIRSPTTTGQLGPSTAQSTGSSATATQETGETFSDSDKMFLEFLWDCYVREPMGSAGRTRHQSIGSLLLRAIGAYPKMRLERNIGSLLLQELGVLAPSTQSYDHNLIVRVPGRRGSEGLDALIEEADKSCRDAGWRRDFTYDADRDFMASLRQPFKLKAFAVDSSKTFIRDDAFSIEPGTVIPNSTWVHIHIAHPSAFFPREHVFGRLAEKLGQSLYTPTEAMHMLPLDLACAISLKSGSPALTISTLLAYDGSVLDVNVQPTILSEVVFLRPEAVDIVTGRTAEEVASLLVGGMQEKVDLLCSEQDLEDAQKHRETLMDLMRILLARHDARPSELPQAADWSALQISSSVFVSDAEPFRRDHLSESYHRLGEPEIKLVATRHPHCSRLSELQRQRDLTTHAMSLAAESAGKWLSDRKIPAQFVQTVLDPDTDLASINQADKVSAAERPAIVARSSPGVLLHLNAKQYVQCTSPLRRYRDLVVQWQIDAYLRAAADESPHQSPITRDTQLAFSKDEMDEHILKSHDRMGSWFKVNARTARSWQLRALFRAFHFNEAELPPVWDMVVIGVAKAKGEDDDTRIRGQLIPFGSTVQLLESQEKWEAGVKKHQYLPVKFEMVDQGSRLISCRAVGPPSDTPTCTDPIKIVPRTWQSGQNTSAQGVEADIVVG
ncbi:hypothetical protein PV10_03655 [Exophiala mesophila]|uniref:RNB domain-containing protein n=1 Tax=Exophiala mesophila TaxID=212818 RepID=A0A0D1X2W5_EXOME|nr:uncharacterized protein PV10_03655 [Exophiala mesophila]KIV96075.1 hypothetical protein PV10_03655 [Exophiala mesophila]